MKDTDTKTCEIKRRRVVFRADAGSRMGMGHFVRTCALAAYLADEFECVIASRNPETGRMSEYQLSLISDAGAIPADVYGDEMEGFDRDFLAFIKPEDIAVLDNYYYSTQYQMSVREAASRLVCIDDMHDRHFVADAVLSCSPVSREDFSLEEYTLFRGGLDWAFLRAPFLLPTVKRTVLPPGSKPGSIAMAMGGADPYHLTDKMISIIRKELPESVINVLAGSSVEIKSEDLRNVRIWRQADAATIAKLFDNADVGIFPASTVCVEGVSRGLPIIAGYYVDNQVEIYNDGVKRGWFAPLGNLTDSSAEISQRLRNAIRDIPSPPAFDFNAQRERIRDIFKNLAKDMQ